MNRPDPSSARPFPATSPEGSPEVSRKVSPGASVEASRIPSGAATATRPGTDAAGPAAAPDPGTGTGTGTRSAATDPVSGAGRATGARATRPRPEARPKGRRLPRPVRHAVNSLHVVTSVGLVGIVWTSLALGLVARSADDPALAHDTYRIMDTLVHVTAVPFAVAAMVTGLVLSFGTPWGLFRHLWVTVKFVLLIAVVALGIAAIGPWVDGLADASAPGGDAARLPELRNYQFAAAGAQLAALAAATALSIFKPSGRRSRSRSGARR